MLLTLHRLRVLVPSFGLEFPFAYFVSLLLVSVSWLLLSAVGLLLSSLRLTSLRSAILTGTAFFLLAMFAL